jgi:O-acetyl-ADP-ribose deacetylase (regulator of RNase III)
MIRLAETSDEPVAAFCASPRDAEHFRGYQLDYIIPSRGWEASFPRRTRLPADSVVRECTAIGFSAQGVESWWPTQNAAQIEAVGIPPYPGGAAPRVVGLLRPVEKVSVTPPCLSYVYGDATAPRGDGKRLIVHIVNDKTANWGGAGFATALRSAWPDVQRDFQDWADHHRASYKLGGVRVCHIGGDLSVASIVAQHGYGPSESPRVRYSALRTGLISVAAIAAKLGATVHMPRIGTGQSGGYWSIVRDIIADTICAAGLSVTVYDLPNSRPQREPQTSLSFSEARAM